MLADRKWVGRNPGFDPITLPPPETLCSAITCWASIAAEA